MTQTIEAIPVHVMADDTKEEKRPKEYRVTHRTFLLTANNPSYNIVGYDPARCKMYMNVLDNPVVLSGSTSQANDANNLTGTLTAPNGRILPISNGSEYCIEGPDETWISTNTYPTRVGVSIVREI
jgi:hypothetical protein